MLLFSFCDINFPVFLILCWLLPFFLGWLLGKLVNNDNDESSLALNSCIENTNELTSKIRDLESKLFECKDAKIELELRNNQLNDQLVTSEEKLALIKLNSKPISAVPLITSSEKIPKKSKNKHKKTKKEYDVYSLLKPNNLQVIEGIGPKMYEILQAHDVKDWESLSKIKKDQLRTILDEYGMKYRMIDPSTWAKQAKMAHHGKWNKLIALQKTLSGGTNKSINQPTDAKVEKFMIKMGFLRKFTQDDLTAIEGIGPKIADVLNNAQINTWKKISKLSYKELIQLLEKAGKRYALADPETWSQQAKLANDHNWDELLKFQNQLKGGRRK